jgi:hypothetical protein
MFFGARPDRIEDKPETLHLDWKNLKCGKVE